MTDAVELMLLGILEGGAGDTTAPTFTVEALSAVANVVSMRITASEEVVGFAVGDITISAGGSLASFTTANNIIFTVSWTLAAGTNTMDIAGGVCTDLANIPNTVASQFTLIYLILQPDATSGVDAFIRSSVPTTNYGFNSALAAGESNAAADTFRTLIKFDLSSIAAGSTIYSVILSLYANNDQSSNARDVRVYRQLRAWVESESTWNIYSTGNSWGTAGGFGAADCEQTDIGSRNFTATETMNQFKDFVLSNSAIQAMITGGGFTNNGFLIKADTEVDDEYDYVSSDGVAGNRPKLALVYKSP